jgi:biotin-dependent carboxylase-like uncharacterized protein
MISAFKVINPGLQTTVQDLGRTGFQDVGVPVSGALDRLSLRLANVLVGNLPGAAALEMVLQGPALEVQADSVRVALVGCNAAIEVDGAGPTPAGRSVRLTKGQVLRVARLGDSGCAYLAVEGGIDVAPSLGSASTYARAAIGGYSGQALRPADLVPLKQAAAAVRSERALAKPLDLAFDQPIRVVLGPQADYFTEAAIATFLSAEYSVSGQSDRMGFRLEGAKLEHAKGYNIVSDGIVTGAIQVPGSGLPIILMADAQTTGGYPKIATVVSADIPVLGRRKAGQKIRFTAVDVSEAEALRRRQEADFLRWAEDLRVLDACAGIDLAALYRQNLVSGVASALR